MLITSLLFPELWKLPYIMTTFPYGNNSFEGNSYHSIHFLKSFHGSFISIQVLLSVRSLTCYGWANCLILFLTRSYLYCMLWPHWTSSVSYCTASLIKIIKFSHTLTCGMRVTWSWWLIFLCPFILNLGIASLKSISLKCQLKEFSHSLIDGYELPCLEIICLVSYMALSIYLLTNVPWPGQLSQESCLSLTSIYFWTLILYLDKLCKYLLNEWVVHKTQLLEGFVPGYLIEE